MSKYKTYQDYPEYQKLFQDLCDWLDKKDIQFKGSKAKFVDNIINKRYPKLISRLTIQANDYNCNIKKESKAQLRIFKEEVERLRNELYGDKPIVKLGKLSDIKDGHYYAFISNNGKRYIMQCVGTIEVWYECDKEWCVADRTWTEEQPAFIVNGAKDKLYFSSEGIELTKEEYETLLKTPYSRPRLQNKQSKQ